jgi:hypothetical protein
MTNKNIHGFEIEYDENSDIVKSYLEHLEYSLSHDEMKAFIDDAKHSDFKKIHLEDKHENKFTLECKDDEKFLLRKRSI